jgi:4'-phosphopantetheinyl transferase
MIDKFLNNKSMLDEGDVHVWAVPFMPCRYDLEFLYGVLSPVEQSDVKRYVFDKDRENAVISRGLLRLLLGHYLNADPKQLQILRTKLGKPYLVSLRENALFFSVSHSETRAIYGITRAGRIGVDIEYLAKDFDGCEIAGQFFTEEENATLEMTPQEYKRRVFFRYWTLKEAYLKGVGTGLSMGLNSFRLIPVRDEEMYRICHNDGVPGTWTLRCVQPWSDYIMSVAVEGDGWDLKFFN